MDKAKLGPPSKNAYVLVHKSDPPSTTGIKRDRLYNSPEFKNAINDVSTQFQDRINGRVGKGDRQNGPDSPITTYMKSLETQTKLKNKNIFRKKK